MQLSSVIVFFVYWSFAFVSLSAALVLLAAYYRWLDSDLGLDSVGKELWIIGIASLIQAGEALFLKSLGSGPAGRGIVAALSIPLIYKLTHLPDWNLVQGVGLVVFQGIIYYLISSLIAGNPGMAAITATGFCICLAIVAGFVRSMSGEESSSSGVVSDIPAPGAKIHWGRLASIRLCLGICGIAAGLLLAAIFVAVWHFTAVLVTFLFGWSAYNWIYLWDLLFVAVLFREGYRYQARMPPPSPFTQPDALLLAQVATGNVLFTPQQAAFSISEMLYVAPRFLFWGIRHIQRIALPSNKIVGSAGKICDALRSAGTWVPYDQLRGMARSEIEAAQALGLLVKAELAEGGSHKGVISFRAATPEWV